MRIALLRNPESGSGEADAVAGLLGDAGADVEAFALDEIDAAVDSRPERMAVAGGDGSIGCVAEAAGRAGLPLAVVPVGTANDFARALGLPEEPAAAARLAARGTTTRPHELAFMGERPFVNVASLGLPPAAARRAHGLKGSLGPAAYAVGALRAALTTDPVATVVRCDGVEVFAGDAWQVTVACSGAFGAGSEVEADPGDGMLDVVVFEASTRASLALRAYGLRRGRVEEQGGVDKRRGSHVELDVAPGTSFNVDGEVVAAGPATFSATAHAFEVVVA